MSNSDYKAKALLDLDNKKLEESLSFFKKELFNLRFQKTLGELTNTSRFAKVRKNIARVETELTRRRKVGAK
ncbi:MAG: 50S ribosomal protein L29 [Rickettsiaceae bacterium]|jgi:large subunit ribosomal protein L29|uniref:50S ribosomal protein L29 n=1 Tax=Candidatus Megaera polyxenophila TaxID=988779 RepID=UPI001B41C3B5|nr:50S ribosomal protein L29 [Rickettsiaceae bacterium]MBU6184334.1 50S ribosomal protein L29 [Rickettsiales bacterium]NBU52849.1 50S ribosomal protein L29 [Alphaproteobacteria bacterium]UCM93582.1 MAG: 50S ribosomal protein L29 [Candidatus Megaira endosymbiont of Mesostigma viride]WHA07135.1 50S ribosomal protein L29 [Candidatus Megaera polyxenophila]